ncbi:eukaryotic translation initiation factor 3 subunit J [Limtongia smithiae]|uniref:eukaryotic translation initiation factor 3 subunit J n=1 Tax=Limtongia smithiae TaxID=1125753 RepID=UPI0034CEF265
MAWDDEESSGDEAAPAPTKLIPKSKWDDEEDSDAPVLDSWDAEDSDSEAAKAKKAAANVPAPQPRKKMTLQERIEEREAQKAAERKAELERRKEVESETAEQRRKRLHAIELQADLDNAVSLFGDAVMSDYHDEDGEDEEESESDESTTDEEDDNDVTTTKKSLVTVKGAPKPLSKTPSAASSVSSVARSQKPIISAVPSAKKELTFDSLPILRPKTKAEFEALAAQLGAHLAACAGNPQYMTTFMTPFLKALCAPLNSEQVRKCTSTLTTMSNEKIKEERIADKGVKKGKGRGKPALSNASAKIVDEVDTTHFNDDFDDFM